MKRVLVCGNSILLAGIFSGQPETGEFEIHRLDDLDNCRDWSGFDVIIIDASNLKYVDYLLQFIKCPTSYLVSLDAAGTLTVLVGASYAMQSIEEVLQWLGEYGAALSVVPDNAPAQNLTMSDSENAPG